MAQKIPVKYENSAHDIFQPGDTIPPTFVDPTTIVAGPGISVTRNPTTGVWTITNLCFPCDPGCTDTTWTDVGPVYCDGDDCVQAQVSNCGNVRTISATGCSPACGGCTPNWVNVGAPFCVGSNCRQAQEDGCGNTREVSGTGCSPACGGPPCEPDWQPIPGDYRVDGGVCQQQWDDGCGAFEWRAVDPVVWTATGDTRCQGGWYQREETNQCGTARWENIEPIEWENTGAEDCVSGTLRVQQANQCGATQWVDTGTPCGEVPALTAPSWGVFGACCDDDPLSGEVALEVSATFVRIVSSCNGVVETGSWVPSGASASDYEFRIERTNPPTSTGTWSAQPVSITASCSNSGYQRTDYSIYWRRAGDSDPTGTLWFSGELYAACGGLECL